MKNTIQCKVKITDFIDSKEFPKLMHKHGIKIAEQKDGRNEIIFTLNAPDDEIEEIMISTNLRWALA
jgi:hypothetical protein